SNPFVPRSSRVAQTFNVQKPDSPKHSRLHPQLAVDDLACGRGRAFVASAALQKRIILMVPVRGVAAM
ncbi:MAG: hypothetical protein AAFV69_10285, partial [Pseudomonadota bacterium]